MAASVAARREATRSWEYRGVPSLTMIPDWIRTTTRSISSPAEARTAACAGDGSSPELPGEHGPLPVPWHISAGIRAQLRSPGASPPGANTWIAGCWPTRHENPVVLVHGGFVNQTLNWQTMAPLLTNAGFRVYSLNYGRPKGSTSGWAPGATRPIAENAREIGEFIDKVRDTTGAARVDILAESFGTLSTNHYAKYLGGHEFIERFVALSGLWDGTTVAALNKFPSLPGRVGLNGIYQEVLHGSEYLTRLRADGIYAPGVQYTNITSKYDELLLPYTTGVADGPDTTNIVLQDGCPHDLTGHFGIAASRRTAAYVFNALDPEQPVTVPCVA